MRILICKKFFDINVIFFFSGKNIFWGIFFMCLNLVKSQKVIKIFENLFLHVILKINCGILALKNFQFEYFEKLDLFHSPAHCASRPSLPWEPLHHTWLHENERSERQL